MGITSLGSTLARPIVTPGDLSGLSGDLLNNKSARIALTLQSLDTDQNPINGISISPQAINYFSTNPLNFDVERDTDFINNLQPVGWGEPCEPQQTIVAPPTTLGFVALTPTYGNANMPNFINNQSFNLNNQNQCLVKNNAVHVNE